MNKDNAPSKVWLISQETSGLSDSYSLPVEKELLFEYKDGKTVGNTKDSDGRSFMLPVGYVIEHEDGNSWERLDDNFSVKNNLVPRPVYSGVEISHLEGELLTVIDASFTDKNQCEAIKSLVRNTLWGFNSRQERKLQEMFKSIK